MHEQERDADGEPAHHARRPMNAFLIFCKRHRSVVRDKYPNLENRYVIFWHVKICPSLWRRRLQGYGPGIILGLSYIWRHGIAFFSTEKNSLSCCVLKGYPYSFLSNLHLLQRDTIVWPSAPRRCCRIVCEILKKYVRCRNRQNYICWNELHFSKSNLRSFLDLI